MIVSRSFPVNGTSQWLYLNLNPKPKGTLLFIHGGPGWSDAPWAGLVCQRLWSEVNTVHWDQRGCNRSQLSPGQSNSLSISQMLLDGFEVCRILKNEFQIQRPVLVGHSWGSFLGVLMASQAPELFHSYVGIGQLVANTESEPLSLEFCKRRAQEMGRNDLVRELVSMPETFYQSTESLFRQREILFELGGEFAKLIHESVLQDWINLSPKEYQCNWNDLYNSCKNSCVQLWPQLIQRNLFDEIQKFEISITLFQGKHDYCTASTPAIKWLRGLSCSQSKEFIQFSQSAHWPQIEENQKFSRLILENLL